MSITPEHLAVYGTLRPSCHNPYALFLRQHSHYIGEGVFPGLLINLGNYPGAIYQSDAQTVVHSSVYNIHQHRQQILSYLDEYEGIGEGFSQPTEYIRARIPVHVGTESFLCWVYLYNWSINEQALIPSGNYSAYVASQRPN
jgi:gamma-glutamylcyclotransferase (GGCT)/AIG2-like uncharacterized protein YtfP